VALEKNELTKNYLWSMKNSIKSKVLVLEDCFPLRKDSKLFLK